MSFFKEDEMKLRIKGNTIRFRLTQTELDKINTGSVEDQIGFPGGNSLTYKIQKGKSYAAEFVQDVLTITVPAEIINDWVTTDKVGIENSVGLTDGSRLDILLEKDFKCLTERPTEDESDMFPNPLEKH